VHYWDKRLQLFGLDRGFLPLYQTDAVATPEEKEWLKVYYCSGEKDIKGRTIICYTNHHLLPTHPAIWYIKTDYILRAMWLSWEAGSMDDEAQKKGSVTIIDLLGFSPHHWDTHYLRTTTDTARRAFPFKPAQIHLLSEPAWMGYFLIMYQNIIGHKLRSRFVSHRGDRNMVIEKLKSEFGIPASVFRNFPMPSDAPP
jgi:putative Ca2+/H+ antiporter (TMEM165/GDT1 family)